MRAQEFIIEAKMDSGIDAALRQKGYRKLGKGIDQNAYLEPGTGMIMKIFRSSRSGGSNQITPGQKTFKAFADYCLANPDNEFLPNFTGWETFNFNGYIYLQIRMERLFSLNPNWGDFLESLAGMARVSNSADHKDVFIRDTIDNDGRWDNTDGAEMLSMLGSDGFNQLWDTISDLSRIAEHGRFKLDLHAGNFMLGSDGHVVISDPFFIGWNHPDLKTADPWEGNDDSDRTTHNDTVDGSMERSFQNSEDEDDEEEIDQYGNEVKR
jgi:hypothetical protein